MSDSPNEPGISDQNQNVFSQIDVTQVGAPAAPLLGGTEFETNILQTLFQMTELQRRQNQLLEALVERMTILVNQNAAPNQQKAAELQKWQTENPFLTDDCREAMEALTKIHTSYIQEFANELTTRKDEILDSEYSFNDFIDKFGPRMMQLNGLIQFLSYLSAQIKGVKYPMGKSN